MPYWRRARLWALANTKAYTPQKAIPPILAAIGQYWFFNMRPMNQTIATIVTITGVYLLLYGLDYTWKLLIQAPVALDKDRDSEFRSVTSKLQDLVGENARLKQPRRTAKQDQEFADAEQALQTLGEKGIKVLQCLMMHGSLAFGAFNPPIQFPVPAQEFREILNKAVLENLVTPHNAGSGHQRETVYEIAPGSKQALEELLYRPVTPPQV